MLGAPFATIVEPVGSGSQAAPKSSPEERSDRWQEYRVLEARMQNDSRLVYGLIAAQYGLAFGFLSALFVYLGRIEDLSRIGATQFLTAIALGVSSIFILVVSQMIQKRLNDTGNVRRARAVQLEYLLGIHSFRLFPPWKDPPLGYLHRLGEIARSEAWNNNPETESQYYNAGDREYTRICKGSTITAVQIFLFWGFVFTFVALLVALTFFH